jgi:hypothetical protein
MITIIYLLAVLLGGVWFTWLGLIICILVDWALEG